MADYRGRKKHDMNLLVFVDEKHPVVKNGRMLGYYADIQIDQSDIRRQDAKKGMAATDIHIFRTKKYRSNNKMEWSNDYIMTESQVDQVKFVAGANMKDTGSRNVYGIRGGITNINRERVDKRNGEKYRELNHVLVTQKDLPKYESEPVSLKEKERRETLEKKILSDNEKFALRPFALIGKGVSTFDEALQRHFENVKDSADYKKKHGVSLPCIVEDVKLSQRSAIESDIPEVSGDIDSQPEL